MTASVTTLGGGCFWCLEAAFQRVRGVQQVQSGYAGGTVANPSYELVCSGTTGHAEVVQVTFDPDVLPFEDVLDIFFAIHDPTTLNRQGGDVGTQYRSAIYFHDAEQERVARETIARLEREGVWRGIVTEVAPLDVFYPAEEYHRDYFNRNPTKMYCQAVISPKLAKLKEKFAARLKSPAA